jgi:hypothetical protein
MAKPAQSKFKSVREAIAYIKIEDLTINKSL